MGVKEKSFIPYYLDIGFSNNESRKECIQKRIGNNTEVNFSNALNNIQGDNRENEGGDFSELVLQALAYFYDKIFPRNKYKIKDSYWNVTTVKGFFDACNLTPYTAIDELVTTCYPLQETALFKHCYLIVQTAYFFNSGKFGRNPYLTYTGHYTRTGEKLPIEKYRGDKEHLKLSYKRLDRRREEGNLHKGEIEYHYVKQWYFSVLYLIVKELRLSERNFKVTNSKYREYNPVIKAPRVLRYETPFLLTHIDIKSAYPSFLDAIVGSNIGSTIYERIARVKGYSRDRAKVYFNTRLNSGKYEYWNKSVALRDLVEWGYTTEQANHVIKFTHGDKSFTEEMSEVEEEAIQVFSKTNSIERYVRLHDAIIYIDNKKPNKEFCLQNGIIRFETEQPKKPNINPDFRMSNRRLPYGYVASLPNLKNLIRRTVPADRILKAEANGFSFFFDKFQYYNASFDLNNKYKRTTFIDACREMLDALYFLNDRKVSPSELEAIVRHIRANSNICFQQRAMYIELNKINKQYKRDPVVKERDWDVTERKTFKTKIEFLNALNEARKKANQIYYIKHVKRRFVESLEMGSIEWIDFELPRQNPNYRLIYLIASKINYLRTGRKRKPKAQNDKYEPLYSTMYKELRSYQIEPQSKYANAENITRRKVRAYERKLLEVNQLQSNIKLAEQYILILNEIINEGEDYGIKPNSEFLLQEKNWIVEQMGEEKFSSLILIKPKQDLTPLDATEDIFPTDMTNSIFNSIDEEKAIAMSMLDDYENFHRLSKLRLLKNRP